MVSAEYIHEGIPKLIKELYAGKICQHADLDMLINQYPCGLAYALALIDTTDYRSITPGWVLYNYPEVEFIVKTLASYYLPRRLRLFAIRNWIYSIISKTIFRI
mgnify:CR=1 FL=1